MKKAFLLACLLAVGCVWTSHAIVIHWATDGYDGLTGVTSASLVYISANNETPVYNTSGVLQNGQVIADVPSDITFTPAGIAEHMTTDSNYSSYSSGSYFVVLFKQDGSTLYYSSSDTYLAYNDTTWDAYTADEMAPAQGVFSPSTFGDWAVVPEPSTALLLVLGTAAAALRRKIRV